ncbi:hypothetical protein K1719_018032 [Acacia pycnantha]|nr:hypothetical protein K1719_018032 [Acacia pycnantha]
MIRSMRSIEAVRLWLIDVSVASDSLFAPAPIESFSDMCLHQSIMKNIAYHEYWKEIFLSWVEGFEFEVTVNSGVAYYYLTCEYGAYYGQPSYHSLSSKQLFHSFVPEDAS